jgi:hypothetical protein
MSSAASARVVTALSTMTNGTPALEKVRSAVYLILTSPAAAIQK